MNQRQTVSRIARQLISLNPESKFLRAKKRAENTNETINSTCVPLLIWYQCLIEWENRIHLNISIIIITLILLVCFFAGKIFHLTAIVVTEKCAASDRIMNLIWIAFEMGCGRFHQSFVFVSFWFNGKVIRRLGSKKKITNWNIQEVRAATERKKYKTCWWIARRHQLPTRIYKIATDIKQKGKKHAPKMLLQKVIKKGWLECVRSFVKTEYSEPLHWRYTINVNERKNETDKHR